MDWRSTVTSSAQSTRPRGFSGVAGIGRTAQQRMGDNPRSTYSSPRFRGGRAGTGLADRPTDVRAQAQVLGDRGVRGRPSKPSTCRPSTCNRYRKTTSTSDRAPPSNWPTRSRLPQGPRASATLVGDEPLRSERGPDCVDGGVHVGAGGDLLAYAGLKTGADLAGSGTDGGFGLRPECIETFVDKGDELLFILQFRD